MTKNLIILTELERKDLKTVQNKEMFAGLKVLELASVLAGPSVGQFFAELGAEVIKVENPDGGDVTRSWKSAGEITDDRSAYFCCCNWGKKSVTLNLHTEGDRQKILRLAASADIVIASYKPGDAKKLGVDYPTLSKDNERLIYGLITGYGSADPRVGYDALIQAESGFMDINGEPDGPPLKMPVALIDVLAAHQLKEALLLALLQRERTEKGSCVEVSLMDAALASLANQGTNWLVAGKLPMRKGSTHPNIAPYGDMFVTADGKRILLAVGSDRQYFDLLKAIGAADDPLLTSAKFSQNQSRVTHRTELVTNLGEYISRIDSMDLLNELRTTNVPGGIIQTVKESLANAGGLVLKANGLAGVRTFVGLPDGVERSALSPPPHLGQHNEEVLRGEG
ncbi:MAG: CoA transferase [Bacteroidetes bacterium]|nr:CoA transferase [Bacteroidota bacterium]